MTRLHSKMTKLEVFNALVRASKAGEFPAWDAKRGQCMYRTWNGRACPLGMFMPDDHPAAGACSPISTLLEDDVADVKRLLPDWMTADVAEQIQVLHDNACNSGRGGASAAWPHDAFVSGLAEILNCGGGGA